MRHREEAPSSARVTARWLRVANGFPTIRTADEGGEEENSAGGGGGRPSGKFIEFMKEEGDGKVRNPDTGNDVKIKSLKGPKGKKLVNQLFKKWLDAEDDEPKAPAKPEKPKDEKPKDEKPKPKDEKPKDKPKDEKPKGTDKPLDIDPAKIPEPDVGLVDFAGKPKEGEEPNAVQHALSKSQKGEVLTHGELNKAIALTQKGKTKPGIKKNEVEQLEELERYWRDMGGLEQREDKDEAAKHKGKGTLPEIAEDLAKKYKLRGEDMGKVKDFAKTLREKEQKEHADHPAEKIRLKHDITQDVIQGVDRTLDLHRKSLRQQYNRSLRDFKEQEKEVGEAHADVLGELADAGFDNKDFEKVRKSKKKPKDMPQKLFDAAIDLPDMPEKPEKPKAKGKDIREYISDFDPDMADSLADLSDEELETLHEEPVKEKTVAQKKKEFMDATDDDDLKARVKDMKPDDFNELLSSFMEDDGGGRGRGRGKRGSLREAVVRVAYVSDPTLRQRLLHLLSVG